MTLTFWVILAKPTIGPGEPTTRASAFKAGPAGSSFFSQFRFPEINMEIFANFAFGPPRPRALRALQVVPSAGNAPPTWTFSCLPKRDAGPSAILEMLSSAPFSIRIL